MSKQELYLFEVPSSFSAKLRTRPPQVMRRQLSKVRRFGIPHHQPPDCLLIPDLRPGDLARFADWPEEAVSRDPGSFEPGIDARLDAGRHRHGTDSISLTCHVGQHPATLPLLQVFKVDPKQLGPAQPAAKQQSQDSAVAQPAQRLRVGRIEETVGLFLYQPVPYPVEVGAWSINCIEAMHYARQRLRGQVLN